MHNFTWISFTDFVFAGQRKVASEDRCIIQKAQGAKQSKKASQGEEASDSDQDKGEQRGESATPDPERQEQETGAGDSPVADEERGDVEGNTVNRTSIDSDSSDPGYLFPAMLLRVGPIDVRIVTFVGR